VITDSGKRHRRRSTFASIPDPLVIDRELN